MRNGDEGQGQRPSGLDNFDPPPETLNGNVRLPKPGDSKENARSSSDWPHICFCFIPIPIGLALIVILALADLESVFEPPGLLLVLNTCFLSLLPFLVAYIAMKGYLSSGSISLIMLAAGCLSLGLGSILAGFMPLTHSGLNGVVAIHNSSALLSSVFQVLGVASALVGSPPQQDRRRKKLTVLSLSLGISAFVALLTITNVYGVGPVFFLQGSGPTPFRQTVLGAAIAMYLVSGLLLGAMYLRSGSRFLFWYCMALFLIGEGLFCISIQKAVGCPIGWLGRGLQYLAGIYLFVAILEARSELVLTGLRLDVGIAKLLRHHLEPLVEQRTEELARANEGLRHEITERVRAEGALKRAKDELEARVQERTTELKTSNEELFREIDERKKVEEALGETSRLNRILIDRMPCVALLLRPRSREIVASNAEAVKVGAVPGAQCFATWGQREDPCPWCLAPKLWETGEAQHLEVEALGIVFDAYWIPVSPDLYMHYAFDITDRKRAEEAMRESEAKFWQLFNNAEVGMFRTRLDGSEILDMNEKFLKIFGRTREEMQGSPSVSHWADPHEREEVVGRLNTDGRVTDFECKMLNKQGEVRMCITSLKLYREQGILDGSIRDITDRKEREKALKESEQRLRLAQDAAKAGTWEWDLRTSENFWSDELWTLYGLEPHGCEPSYEAWLRMIHPDDRAVAERTVQEAASKGTELNAEWRTHSPNGPERWLMSRGRPIYDEKGQVLRYIGIVIDITDRKRAAETIRGNLEFLTAVMESLSHPFYVINANDYTIVMANSASNLDLSSGESACYALTHHRSEPCNGSEHPCPLEEVKKTRRSVVLEHMHYDKDGNVRNVEVHAHPILDAQRNVAQVIEYCFDITERKRAEDALRQTTERLELVLEGADLGLWDLDVRSGQAVVNQRGADLFGYSLDEIEPTFDFWVSLIHPDDRLLLIETFNSTCDGRIAFVDVERRVRHKSGEWKWIQVRGKVVEHDKDGRPLRMAGTFMDITRRKREEEELRETTARLKAVVNASPEIIYFKDLNGRNLIVNKGLAELVGMEEKDIVGRTDQELFPPDLADQCLRSDNKVLKRREPVYVEESMLDDKGRKIFFGTIKFPVLDHQGNLIGLGGVSRDITERKHAEGALRESERRNRLLIEESPVGIGIWRDLRLIYANPAFLETFGYENQDEVLDRPAENFVIPESRELIRKRGEDRLAGKPVPPSYEVKGLKKNGDSFDLALWPRRIDYLGEPAILGFVADRTEEKNLRAQLLQAQKMEAIGNLAGGVAHDFNNLLTVVQGYSELLLFDENLKDNVKTDLERINYAAKSGADLVRRLLMFSKKSEMKPRPMSLNRQIAQTKSLLSRTISKTINVELRLADELPAIEADPVQMEQVLMNLAVNATDAMPDGGTLVIETEQVTLGDEYLNSHFGVKSGNYVLLSFSDTGEGIDKESLEHIFEPFFTTKSPGKGTGLGLAVVYGIVKQHGGHITCFSEPRVGTTFKIYLPVVEMQIEPRTLTDRTKIPGGTETVLLVDDEQDVRDLGERILTLAGYKVLTAAHGREALDIFTKEKEKISLVILDLIMPEMDGHECLKKILQIDPQARVIVSSGYSANGSQEKTSESGAKGFVGKPYDMRQMIQAVREVLDER